ncbi:uncharacterized protein BX664DRAFT_340199 [Halteromyces radiatus]|uniref:uncharacterized protein n=1 Tax=Halteromyces radiatus TaxID=101107 RepID=UPI00221E9BFD|nr:uncharacterized protein BX664DRAFT_340199 [Halteromyces radiatus]KAI8081358.1 hypothetical protein BX664DRAFT_340199 [Halteromyces radiatus]
MPQIWLALINSILMPLNYKGYLFNNNKLFLLQNKPSYMLPLLLLLLLLLVLLLLVHLLQPLQLVLILRNL